MGRFQSFSEEIAGLRYALRVSPPNEGRVSVLLSLADLEEEPWRLLDGEDARPSEPNEDGIRWPAAMPRLIREARADTLRVAELLTDGERGWALPMTLGLELDDLEIWALRALDRRRIFFQTGWMRCASGHVRQRLRREADGYHLHVNAMALDWHELARTVILQALENTQKGEPVGASGLDGPVGRTFSLPLLDTLSLQLVTAAQADPELAHLTLEASTFEQIFRTLAQALAGMQTEYHELHEQVAEHWQQVEDVMKRYVPEMLQGTAFSYAMFSADPEDLELDDEDQHDLNDTGLYSLNLFTDVRRRQPQVVTFDNHVDAFDFIYDYQQNTALPAPMLLANPATDVPRGDKGTGRTPAYLMQLAHLLTGDLSTGEITRWVAQAHPDWSAGQVLHWFWKEWKVDQDYFAELNYVFKHIDNIRIEKKALPFRDAEGLHTYLLAQIEANGFRVIQAHVQGEKIYTAVVLDNFLPGRTPLSRRVLGLN